MFILLYASLSCTDVVDMISRVNQHEFLGDTVKKELVVTIKEATPHCTWDAND